MQDILRDDQPIQDEPDDQLGRAAFACKLGDTILSWHQSNKANSIVIAVTGAWGAGKSSVINLTLNHINHIANKEGPKVKIINFNPWVFREQGHLSKSFFMEIANKLKGDKSSAKREESKKLVEYLTKQARSYNPSGDLIGANLPTKKTWIIFSIFLILYLIAAYCAGYAPSLWWRIPAAIHIVFAISLACYLYKKVDEARISANSASENKEEIRKSIEELELRLVIVIDDIDRLNAKEIREVLSLIKKNADFPNTLYLLAFDQDVVIKSLEKKSEFDSKYLNKIVQVSLHLPAFKEEQFQSSLRKEINQLLESLSDDDDAIRIYMEDKGDLYLQQVYECGFLALFTNVRDIKRFVNGWNFNIENVLHEGKMCVNPIDFMVIEALRIFAADIYDFIKLNKKLFTLNLDALYDSLDNIQRSQNAQNTQSAQTRSGPVIINQHLNKLLEKKSDADREAVRELILCIFPASNLRPNLMNYRTSQRVEMKICEWGCFDRYFTLSTTTIEKEPTESEREEMWQTIHSQHELEEYLRDRIKDDRITLFLDQFLDLIQYNYGKIENSLVLNIIRALLNIADKLPPHTTSSAVLAMAHALYSLQDMTNAEKYNLIKKEMQSTRGLTGAVDLTFAYTDDATFTNGIKLQLTDAEKRALQKISIAKIKTIDKDDLLKLPSLLFILDKWRRWDLASCGWKDFIADVKNDDERLIQFASRYITTYDTYTSRILAKKEFKFLAYSIAVFLNIEDLMKQMKSIKQNKRQLYKKHKKIIDLILDPENHLTTP